MPDPVAAGETAESGETVALEEPPVQTEDSVPPEEPVQTVEETPPVVEPSNSQTDPIQDDLTAQDPPADPSNTVPVDPQPEPEPVPAPGDQGEPKNEPDSEEPGSDEVKDPDASDQEEPDRPIEFHVTVDTIEVVAKTTTSILPEGAEMRVSRITEANTAEYQAAEAALEQKQVEYDGMIALDISFYKDGQEIEPENGTVSIQTKILRDSQMDDAIPESVEMHHINEQGIVEAQKVASAANGNVVVTETEVSSTFEVDSFSTFTITWTLYYRPMTIVGTPVDTAGNELSASSVTNDVSSSSRTIIELAPEIDGYNFLYAHEPENQNHISKIERSKTQYTLVYENGGEKEEPVNAILTTSLNITFVYQKVRKGIAFDANGGSTTPEPSFIEGEPGEDIQLPDYSGLRNGYVFEGWSPVRNPQQAAVYHPVLAAGSYYTIPAGTTVQTLYAVWRPEGPGVRAEARFFVRLDGKIPDEPGSHEQGDYTSVMDSMVIAEAIQKPYWLIDLHPGTIVSDQYYSNNGVSENLNKFPILEAVQAAVAAKGKTFNPETQYIHWYVQKYENGNVWNIDGVIMERDLVSVSYDKNCPDTNVTVPAGFQKDKNTTIKVGRTASQQQEPQLPVRSNYTFVGWNTSPDGRGTHYDSDDPYVLTTNTTFYAQWEVVKKGVTLTKRVVGELADPSREFAFTVKIFDENGIQTDIQTCQLSNGKSKTFKVPVNGYYEIVEDCQEYTPSYSINGANSVQSNDTGHQTMTKSDTRVVFTNRKDGVVPTGIDDHHNGVWTTVLVFGFIALLALFAVNGKKREDERDC